MSNFYTAAHSPMRVDPPRRTFSLPAIGSFPVHSLNRRAVSLPIPTAHSFMDVDLPPQAPTSPKRKVTDVDGNLANSIRRTPTHPRDSKRRRLNQPALEVGRKRRNRPVCKLAKARKAFLKRTQGVVGITQFEPHPYPFCYPLSYPTDLQVLQQVAPQHFSPRLDVSCLAEVALHIDAPMHQDMLVCAVSQVDFPMASASTQSLACQSQPVGLGLFMHHSSNGRRIVRRARQLQRAHAHAKSRAAIDKFVRRDLPRAIRRATQTKKVAQPLEEVRKGSTPYLGSFERKRRRAYHPVLRLAPLHIPVDLGERFAAVAATFGRAEEDVDMTCEETTFYDDTTVDDQDDMEVYFTPLPSYDMLSSALSETAMDIMPSVEVAPMVLPTAHVQAPMVETVSPALPDYEEGMSEVAAQVNRAEVDAQQPARPTFLLDALLQVSTPATSSAEDTLVYDNEDEDAKEDEEVWYEASDEEATLLAQADDLLAIISAELGATDASADTAEVEREELFEELFGPEPTSDPAIEEEDFFKPLTLDHFNHGSSGDGVNSRRAMRYRPVPGVSFDD